MNESRKLIANWKHITANGYLYVAGFRCFINCIYYLLLRVFTVYLSLYSMYVTMSISIGLYPSLDLWNANKLHYITAYAAASTT